MRFRRYVQPITRNGNSLTVVLPRPLLAEMGITRGEFLNVARVGNSILLTPVSEAIRERVSEDAAVAAAPAPAVTA